MFGLMRPGVPRARLRQRGKRGKSSTTTLEKRANGGRRDSPTPTPRPTVPA
jgi:hypothetical protein